MKQLLSLLILPFLASGSPVLVDSIHNEAAPILSSSNAKELPNSYIIVFKKHVTDDVAAAHHSWVQDIHLENQITRTELRKREQFPFSGEAFEGLKHTYNIAGGLLGYSGHFDDDTIERVRRHPDVSSPTACQLVAVLTGLVQVDYIERDSEVHTMGHPSLEVNAPWGLARISHRHSLSFGTFNKYLYSEDAGEGVDAYVIDTGTNYKHVDFEGRAHWGKTIPLGDTDEDGNGHGTHCSGTIAGKKFGVAKKANVYAVKVLRSNGSGSMSDVIKGVEWATTTHVSKVKDAKNGKNKKFKGSVANMSLGGGKSVALDLAVNAAVEAGLHFAVAAGNDNADSCNYSPAAAAKAITVGASTLADERAYFSNFGKCNDIFAPGLNIVSAWKGSKYATNIISGTSMASPHICGLLAYFVSLQPSKDSGYAVGDISPAKMKANILAIATEGVLTDVPSDTANILAWNGGGKDNYTEIVKDGGYTITAKKTGWESKADAIKDELKHIAEEVEHLVIDY